MPRHNRNLRRGARVQIVDGNESDVRYIGLGRRYPDEPFHAIAESLDRDLVEGRLDWFAHRELNRGRLPSTAIITEPARYAQPDEIEATPFKD